MIELHRVVLSTAAGPSQSPLDLSIRDGETVVLLGPAGCGKESLVRILSGLESPAGGLVRVVSGGLEMALPQLRRYASLLIRDDPLPMPLTVRETLELHCLLKGNGREQSRLMRDQAIDTYGLEKTEEMSTSSLPGDWKRYVALACTLIQRTDLLLLEEPFEGLNPPHRMRALEMVQKGVNGRTLIAAVSETADAEALGGRLLLFRDGALRFDGTCQTALSRTGEKTLAAAARALYGEVSS